MHTLEMAVVIPLLFFVILGGLGLSVHTVKLVSRQIEGYAESTCTDVSDCVQVLRITEVAHEILDEFEQP